MLNWAKEHHNLLMLIVLLVGFSLQKDMFNYVTRLADGAACVNHSQCSYYCESGKCCTSYENAKAHKCNGVKCEYSEECTMNGCDNGFCCKPYCSDSCDYEKCREKERQRLDSILNPPRLTPPTPPPPQLQYRLPEPCKFNSATNRCSGERCTSQANCSTHICSNGTCSELFNWERCSTTTDYIKCDG